MSWEHIKESIYFEDGSLRDIYVLNTTQQDWFKWAEHVNSKYKVEFYNGLKQSIENRINIKIIEEYWAGNSNCLSSARIFIREMIVMCYFFSDLEIENDIQPKEVKSVDDHLALLKYLKEISRLLQKELVLTEESTCEHVLLTIREA
jgi:hypothetical protein